MRVKWISEILGFEKVRGYKVYEDGMIKSYMNHTFDPYSGRVKGIEVDYNGGKIIKGSIDSKGYRYIDLRRFDCYIKNPKIHRLVALAFLQNPKNKPQINHIDGDKQNNRVENLEFVSNRQNREHAISIGIKDEIVYGIAQYDLEGNLIGVFNTAFDALVHLGVENPKNRSGNIGRCIRGSRKTAYGYVWKQHKGPTTISKESTP